MIFLRSDSKLLVIFLKVRRPYLQIRTRVGSLLLKQTYNLGDELATDIFRVFHNWELNSHMFDSIGNYFLEMDEDEDEKRRNPLFVSFRLYSQVMIFSQVNIASRLINKMV